ncbi:MAG TPA: hypothetical protein VI232_22685 [Reyranella sp.]
MKKRGFLVLALVMTTAGVASAFAPVPQESAARPPARELALPIPAKQPAFLPVAPAPEPVVKKASFEVRQAPVPLLMKARPPIEQKTFVADAVGPEVPAKTSDGSGESAAKAAIEADGYKGVKVLRQGANGIWFAKAMRGTTEVPVTVDSAGRVALE